ncbi:DAK2 domain-containing protein [Variovorax arabinosiphilus]|uniref:DAK2 domain-containing protein n=1 Tax=Variovorax arabinosiphilus TaxID=3053498 RepID=UPI003365AD7D
MLVAPGAAVLGDETALDGLQAIAQALATKPQDAALLPVARRAARDALDALRETPNPIGRACMLDDKAIGLDDLGVVALQRMVDAV